jgi:hypothetical protein
MITSHKISKKFLTPKNVPAATIKAPVLMRQPKLCYGVQTIRWLKKDMVERSDIGLITLPCPSLSLQPLNWCLLFLYGLLSFRGAAQPVLEAMAPSISLPLRGLSGTATYSVVGKAAMV